MGEVFWTVVVHSFYVFERNYIDLKETIEYYISLTDSNSFDAGRIIELNMIGGREVGRMIHNYLAAWFSLKEHTMAIKNKIPKNARAEIKEFGVEYQRKVDEVFKGNPENILIGDMRRYVQHRAPLIPNLSFKLLEARSCFELNYERIKSFDWNSKSREYLGGRKNIPLQDLVDDHFLILKEFYLWIHFRDWQLHPYATNSMKCLDFETWKEQTQKEHN